MKKLLIALLTIACYSYLNAQVATNNVVNTATIYATNSPVIIKSTLTVQSNLFVGGFIAAGTNATLGIPVGAHFLLSSNAGNPVLVLRNLDPTGFGGFFIKNSLDTDVAAFQWENNTSNIVIRNFVTTRALILRVDGGSNELKVQANVTTNTGAFVSGSVNSTNYMVGGVRGLSLSVTNVGLGTTNVEVFAQGLLTNKFTLP